MEIPRVNPVGVVEYPEDYFPEDYFPEDAEADHRRFSRRQRFFASTLILFFFTATIVTSVLSIGAYCLTSDGGDTRALQESVRRWTETEPASGTLPMP